MLEHGDHGPGPAQVAAPVDGPEPLPLPLPPLLPQESPRELALAIALLSIVGLSVVYCVQAFSLADPVAFLVSNRLGKPDERLRLLGMLGVGLVLPALMALAIRLRYGVEGSIAIRRWSRLLSPLALVGLLPTLFEYKIGHGQPMYYLTVLSLLALLLRPALQSCIAVLRSSARSERALPTTRRPVSVPFVIVVVAALGYAAYFTYYTVMQHRLLLTTAFDLGIYDNLMFNALHGRPFHSPVLFGPGERIYLAGHAELAMLLFLPLYAIAPGPVTMLVIQATTLGLAAIPLYLFAARSLPRGVAACVSCVYLLFAPLHQPNFYDFHWLPLAAFFHFTAYYALAAGRNLLFWTAFAVLLLIREDVSVGTAILGVFLMLATNRARLGLAVTAVSLVWFVAIKFVLMPSFGTWWFEGIYKGLFADGEASYGSVVKTLLSNPLYSLSTLLTTDKATYLLHMLAPLAFLPVRRPQLWLLAAPGMAFTLLTTEYWPTTSIRFQYTAHWIPYLFFAVVLSLSALRTSPHSFVVTWHDASKPGEADAGWRGAARTRLLAWTLTLLCCGVAHSYAFGAVLQQEKVVGGFREVAFDMNAAQEQRYQELRKLVALIPQSASVAATEYMSPHVSTRKVSYVLRQPVGTPDFVLLSSREVQGEPKRVLTNLFQTHSYVLVASTAKEFYLFKPGARDAATEAALKTLRLHDKPVAKK